MYLLKVEISLGWLLLIVKKLRIMSMSKITSIIVSAAIKSSIQAKRVQKLRGIKKKETIVAMYTSILNLRR